MFVTVTVFNAVTVEAVNVAFASPVTFSVFAPAMEISPTVDAVPDESRLMVLNRKEKTIEHKMFKDVIDYFDEGDVMIMNNTKVFPARLYGNKEKTGDRIEVFLLRELNRESLLWDVLVDQQEK